MLAARMKAEAEDGERRKDQRDREGTRGIQCGARGRDVRDTGFQVEVAGWPDLDNNGNRLNVPELDTFKMMNFM